MAPLFEFASRRLGLVENGQVLRAKTGKNEKKNLRNPKISKVFGGDKRDRTADLLNAMSVIREQNEF